MVQFESGGLDTVGARSIVRPFMAKKPQRPRDQNSLAKLVVDLATGEAVEPKGVDPKRSKRGEARAAKLK
jgi:hypothetical protein